MVDFYTGIFNFRVKLFKKQVAVDAAEAECADCRAAGGVSVSFLPGFGFGLHLERAVVKGAFGRRAAEIEGRGQGLMF